MAIMATLLVSGCVKEEMQSGVTVLTAGIETKTVLQNDEVVLWTNGDKVNVNGVESAALELAQPSASAAFTFDAVLNNPYCAVFPASIYKDATIVTLPATQKYVAGTFAQNASPMAAYTTTGDNLRFQHLCAVLKLTVTKPADSEHNDIAYVEFSGKNGEQVSGDFTIDFASMTLTGASTAEADKKVCYNVSSEFVDGALTLYVVVPAAEYSNGYTVKVVDAQGHYMEQSKKSAQTLAAGRVYEMPAFEFVPAGTQLDVEITSAAELISFIADYNAGQTPAVAVIKSDFAFSDEENAAFQSINSLSTVIEGNNCTISNFNSGKPLAVETTSSSAINNLTIAGAAALEGGEADKYVATFAGVHGGVISNCTNKVCYTVAGTQTAGTLYVGGLAGKVAAGSEVANSTSEASFYVTTGTEGAAYIGAVAGYNEGTIKMCTVNPVADDAKPSQMCGNDDERQATGTVLVTGTTLMNSWIGGVAGRAASSSVIEECTNNVDITTNFYKGDATPLLSYVAGVAGENAGKVLSCTNNGPLSLYSAETTRYSAGVVGLNTEGAAVKDCSNTADVINGNSGAPSYAANETYTGGVIAVNESTDVANVTNSGALKIERMKTDNSAVISMGGCFGELKVALDGNNKITNSGNITWTETKNCSSDIGYSIGGVAGCIHSSLNGVTNTGNVVVSAKTASTKGKNVYLGGIAGRTTGAGQITMSSNTNSGNVQFDAQPYVTKDENGDDVSEANNARTYSSIFVGGILGYNPEAALTVENCSNSGYVHTGINNKSTKAANKYIGGIVGYLKGASAVKSCAMTGAIYNDDFNNNTDVTKGAVTGGVVGRAEGADGVRIVIDKCTVDPAEPVKGREVAARRGWFGGVIGHASYTDVTECSVNSLMSGSFYFSGGVCGEMIASTVKQCTVEGNQTSTQTYYAGGLVGKMDGTSSLDNSSVRGTITSSSANARSLGSLVAEADSGASVTNCKYKVTFTVSKATPTTGVIAVAAEGVIQSGNTELTE